MLRIVTWNCCRASLEVSLGRVRRLKPHIVAIQECSTCSTTEHAWVGGKRHGVGVVANLPFRTLPVKTVVGARVFLPLRIRGPLSFNMVAIWAKRSDKRPAYVNTIRAGIAELDSFIRSNPTVIVGDLNTARFLSAGNSHMELVEHLENRYGLISAYHAYHDCEHGDERHSTLYHRRDPTSGHHIDYCFIPTEWRSALKRVTVGNSTWINKSDHVPVAVDLDFPTRIRGRFD